MTMQERNWPKKSIKPILQLNRLLVLENLELQKKKEKKVNREKKKSRLLKDWVVLKTLY